MLKYKFYAFSFIGSCLIVGQLLNFKYEFFPIPSPYSILLVVYGFAMIIVPASKYQSLKHIQPTEIIGNPISLGNFEVAQFDLPNIGSSNIKKIFSHGWRLPTKEELQIIIKHKEIIGGLTCGQYMCTYSQLFNQIWHIDFKDGVEYLGETAICNIRLVRTIKSYKNSDGVLSKSTVFDDIVTSKSIYYFLTGSLSLGLAFLNLEYHFFEMSIEFISILTSGGLFMIIYSFVKYGKYQTIKNIKPKQILGNPIPVGDFEVAQFDLPSELEWNDVNTMIEYFGNDWRLPTKEELHYLFRNKDIIGGFANAIYFSSTIVVKSRNSFDVWMENFIDGNQLLARPSVCFVRLVRTLNEYNNPDHLIKKKFT
jgi:hypothetical protein